MRCGLRACAAMCSVGQQAARPCVHSIFSFLEPFDFARCDWRTALSSALQSLATEVSHLHQASSDLSHPSSSCQCELVVTVSCIQHRPLQPGTTVPCAAGCHTDHHAVTILGNSTGCRLLLSWPRHSPQTALPIRPSYRPTPAAWMPQSTLCLWPPGRARKRLMYSWSTVSSARPLAMPPSSCTPQHGDTSTFGSSGFWGLHVLLVLEP